MNIRKPLFSMYKQCHRSYGIGNVYFIRIIDDFIISRLRSVADVQGHKMFLDPKDQLGLFPSGVYEPFETEIVKREIKKDDVVLDIGANIGYYTLLFAQLVGPGGKVFAFEPDPDNFALLEKNVKVNGYRNVVLVNKAVSNKNGKITLYLSADMGDQRTYDPGGNRKSIEIESVRLDDYFKNNLKVNFIKMDIQGAEWEAIQGMERLLWENKDLKIITEFWPNGLRTFGITPEDYLKFLIDHGFQPYHMNERMQKIEPINLIGPLEAWMPDDRSYTNLLCVNKNSF